MTDKLKIGDLCQMKPGARAGEYTRRGEQLAANVDINARFYGILFAIKTDETSAVAAEEYWVHLQNGKRVFFWDDELEKVVV
jgi:hypothetical protein